MHTVKDYVTIGNNNVTVHISKYLRALLEGETVKGRVLKPWHYLHRANTEKGITH